MLGLAGRLSVSLSLFRALKSPGREKEKRERSTSDLRIYLTENGSLLEGKRRHADRGCRRREERTVAESYTTYSQITTHRGCPQRFNYAYVRGLKKIDPEDVKVELEFGNWWHALRAADSIERGSAAG